MRVLLLLDRSFARREHAMLRRLEIGLLADGHPVCRALPIGCSIEPTTGLSAQLEYAETGMRLFLTPRPATVLARRIHTIDTLERSSPPSHLDIIHGWGENAWRIGYELALATGAALVFEVWSDRARRRIRSFENRTHRLHAAGSCGLWLVPDSAMLTAVDQVAQRWPVRESHWGVHIPDNVRRPAIAGAPLTIAILASGNDPDACMMCLSGIKRSLADHPDVLLFLDSKAVERHANVWKHARALGLLGRLSLVPQMESHRDLAVQADVLIQPEARGEHRTLLLDVMAQGGCVVAASDPLVADLEMSRAVLVGDASPGAWGAALADALDDTAHRKQLGAAARSHIAEAHSVHAHIDATLAAYVAATADQPLAFVAQTG